MNVSSIKTPGVYINEIDAFPQSVAQVATAIPAFVGYTEKGPTEPTRIVSMMEYLQKFGGAPQPSKLTIKLDGNNSPTSETKAEESIFNLYNSLQLFYANGGGECYIVSVGNYSNQISKGDFTSGIDKLESFDEPTLILFPDAVELSAAELGNVQQHALKQCQKLMDRFVVMDVKQQLDITSDSLAFRDNVGINSLKYGAAYYPYLVANFSNSDFDYQSINKALPASKKFKDLYPNNTNITKLDDYLLDLAVLSAKNIDFATTSGIVSNAELKTGLEKSLNLLKVFGKSADYKTGASSDLKTKVDGIVSGTLKSFLQNIVDLEAAYNTLKAPDGGTPTPISPALSIVGSDFDSNWSLPLTANATTYKNKLGVPGTSNNFNADYSMIQFEYSSLHKKIASAIGSAIDSINAEKEFMEQNLLSQLPLYGLIVAKLNQSMNTTPPSGAVVGAYAQTDSTRGVWKAPANLSLNGIIGLTDDVNDSEQEPMNIHETGKSINAIRKFTGKGFLVWGARTLDGNSNDWRYVNVRRLANMIEESVKKACMHYVFEPNVSQTWVNVKGMIENYLSTVWNDGGLAGAKPEHAFFVAVGLNQTMTAQDILEGRMIVKVGYAPSRPAEFIILEFKQMLQQS